MLGLETTVTIGKQSSAAAPTTLARQSLNVYAISGGASENMPEDNILGGGLQNASDPVAPGPGLDDHRLTVRVPLCIAQFPWWCAAFFGTETAGGSTPDYTHDWTSGAALPYIFLEHKLKSGVYRRHSGLIGESIAVDLSSEKEGFAMAELTFVGMKETTAGSALPGAITAAPALDRPAEALVNIAYNAVAGAPVLGGKFTFKRDLKRLRAADGTGSPYAVEQNGISSLDGSLRIRYTDETLNADAIARTERATSLDLLRTAARGITFDLPHMRLARTPVDIDGPDGVEMDVSFKGWQNASDAALAVQVLNSAATVAFS